MPAGAVAPYRPQPGYFDKSGSGALGLAPALASALASTVDGARKANPRLAVRGEVRRALVKDGEATVECSLALLHDGVRRTTLQTTARARDKGAARDRLLRIAAEQCGKSLAPDVTVAIGHLSGRTAR
jgi:hypothetical protein